MMYADVYQWAVITSAEGGIPDPYMKPEIADRLKMRLESTRGNLIGITGLQGVGKTSLRFWLETELSNAYSINWISDWEASLKTFHSKQYDKEYISFLINELYNKFDLYGEDDKDQVTYHLEKQFPKWKRSNELTTLASCSPFELSDEDIKKIRKIVPAIERKLGTHAVLNVRYHVLQEFFENANLLIDFPDYPRSPSQYHRDLRELQIFWEKMQIGEGVGTENPRQIANIVLFLQEEAQTAHFFEGKLFKETLPPFKPSQLVEFYKSNFGLEPFTDEAIQLLASLSRGFMRWFKKYILTCLERYYLKPQTITAENVNNWITLDLLEQDWERLLRIAFPKNRGHRRKSIMILRHLQQKGATIQRDITIKYFGPDQNDAMTASRVLGKLEAHGHIIRTYDGRDKVVEVKS